MHLQNKYPLSAHGDRRSPATVWMWFAIVVAVVGVFAFVVSRGDDGNAVDPPKPIYIEDLGIQEWEQHAEITRQTMAQEGGAAQVEGTRRDKAGTEAQDPFHITGKIKKNQTVFAALKSHGLDVNDIQQVIAAMQGVVDFRKTKPGDQYDVQLDVDRRILKFTYTVSPEDISIAEQNGNEYVASKVDVHRKVTRIVVSGRLETSLYQAFVGLGESGELASHFMQLFKYDIDFGNDSQQGDEFRVLVDKVTLNGEFYRYERVWAATYMSGAKKKLLEAYYYDSDDDYAGYYDADGNALKKTFLKTPVVGCFISSPFNPKRMHPILKRVRPHNGTDWACNTGTPVMAFADGVVTYADWKGGNGNLLVIEHAHGYTSIYAHLYTFAMGIKKGAKVKQGQVVAQVGNTGISTGPHLHFGVKLHGKYVDPVALDSRHAFTLSGSRLHAFLQKRDSLREGMRDLMQAPAVVPEATALPETGTVPDNPATPEASGGIPHDAVPNAESPMPVPNLAVSDGAVTDGEISGTEGATKTDSAPSPDDGILLPAEPGANFLD